MPGKLSKKHRVPSSGVGRFILDIIKSKPTSTAPILGKRVREAESESETSTASHTSLPSRSPSSSEQHDPAPRPACVALQNDDPFLDAVVITALPTVPFCCHADLVTMTRAELVAVAATLNAQLPRALRIDVGPTTSAISIRHAVEVLVGLRESMPQTMPNPMLAEEKAFLTPCKTSSVPPSPLSPLASRGRGPVAALGTPSLAVLRETSEPSVDTHATPFASPDGPPSRKKRRTGPVASSNSIPNHDVRFTIDRAGPITRAQSRRVTPLLMQADAETNTVPLVPPVPSGQREQEPGRVLRTRSAPLCPSAATRTAVISPRRGRRMRAGGGAGDGAKTRPQNPRSKTQSFATTSTPKKRAIAAVHSPGHAVTPVPRFRSLLAEVQNVGRGAGMTTGLSGDKGKGRAYGELVDGCEVSFGLDGYTIGYAAGEESSVFDFSRG